MGLWFGQADTAVSAWQIAEMIHCRMRLQHSDRPFGYGITYTAPADCCRKLLVYQDDKRRVQGLDYQFCFGGGMVLIHPAAV